MSDIFGRRDSIVEVKYWMDRTWIVKGKPVPPEKEDELPSVFTHIVTGGAEPVEIEIGIQAEVNRRCKIWAQKEVGEL